MERNVPYLAVGIVVLVLLSGLAAFTVWQAGRYEARGYERYTIRFESGVGGISEGGTVRYRGVEVGRVADIRLMEEDPGTVRVDIEVQPNTPVTESTVAQILPQGITGISYVELTTEGPGPPPKKLPGEPYPVIESTPSPMTRIMEELPKVGKQVTRIADRVERVLSEENLQDLRRIMDNTAKLSGRLNELSGEASRLVAKSTDLVDRTSGVVERADGVLAGVDLVVGEARTTFRRTNKLLPEVRGMIPELQRTLGNIRSLSKRLDQLVARNEGNLDRFAGEGLDDLHQLLREGRRTLEKIRFLVKDLHRNPSQLLYPEKEKGVELPE